MTSAPLTEAEMIERAGRGVGKVDRDGLRGATLVTLEEIEAMALVLALRGIPAIPPGQTLDQFIRARATAEAAEPIFRTRRKFP